MNEEEMLKNELKVLLFSPELQVWRTPLNQKLLITGTCGMNPELIEEENNFPRFRVIAAENETDDDILERIQTKGDEIISSLQKIRSNVKEKRENKRDQGKVYTTQKRRKIAKKKNKASFPSDSEPEESHTGKGK